ncbi:YfhJ family protein [Bacillus dakarensis]|uniref:YfhJ family protein n=1 Tax=Robertmurraya dakarensis TaxID=1926278 RepID=UPI000980FC01|nr:YfhJ family protein [Bacillus dakarensis]
MREHHQKLVELLLEKNDYLSYGQAQTWIELLWDDFETTRAKAGRDYKGSEMTEKVVRQWIENYGEKLHEFLATNPKYKHLLEQDPKTLN